jgi:hypothetical protein
MKTKQQGAKAPQILNGGDEKMLRLKNIYTKKEISNHMCPISGEDVLEEYHNVNQTK